MKVRKVFCVVALSVPCLALLLMVRKGVITSRLSVVEISSSPLAPPRLHPDFAGYVPLPRECGGVLNSAPKGHWVQGHMTPKEVKAMDTFLRVAAGQHGVEWSLEREDGRCGNVSYAKSMWLRALCNPTGETPCCQESRCVDLPVDNCTCPDCHDLRSQIYSEHSQWVADEPRCQIRNFSQQEACQVSRDSVLIFVGDSYMRHLYTASLVLLSGNPHDGALAHNASEEVRKECMGLYMFTEKLCRLHLKQGVSFCNNTVLPSLHYADYARYGPTLGKLVRSILHRPNHFLFISNGLHEHNNVTRVFEFARPALEVLNSSRAVWPKLVWIGLHANGLMKSHRAEVLHQHDRNIQALTRGLREKFRPYGLPLLDAYNFSVGVSSFDGTHQGMGVNMLKMQTLLNYIAEVRTRI